MVGKTERGIETGEKLNLIRASHKALIESLAWIKGPLFLQVENHLVGLDMFWISSLLNRDMDRIVPVLRSGVLNTELRKYNKRVLHIGPVFVSLYWVVSELEELKKGKIIADVPLFGTTITYKHDLLQEEVFDVYKNARRFIERSLRGKKFNGICFWGFIDNNIISPNMFFFSRNKRMVHAKNIYDGEEFDHSFFFELGDELESPIKKKYVTFFVSSKGRVRYNLKKMKLGFEIYDNDDNVCRPLGNLRETIEIPFSDFMLRTRPNAFNLHSECFEGDEM